MKNSNGKWNKPLAIGVLLYGVMLLDIVVNTAIAHISNNGVSRITNAPMVGPFVINPVSVLSAFAIGTILVCIGLFVRRVASSK